jgi:osmoprotectant transport system substrate-binding protein
MVHPRLSLAFRKAHMIRRYLTVPTAALALAAATALTLAGCASPGSSSGEAGSTDASASGTAAVCDPIPDQQLVVLADDQHLQTVDNIVPAANAAAVARDGQILTLLDTVSAALTTDKLIALNKAVDVDRATSTQAAKDFVEAEGLAATSTSGSGPIVVGAANFSESATLAAVYAEVLRSAGYAVTVQSLDAREVYLPALENGQLTVFPEYVGTPSTRRSTGRTPSRRRAAIWTPRCLRSPNSAPSRVWRSAPPPPLRTRTPTP